MKNKLIAEYTIAAFVLCMIATMAGGATEGDFTRFVFFGSIVGFYVFGIWGLVRLIKSNE